jgi:hypothetical protein
MILAVLVVFCSRFMADQKSSHNAQNLAYSSTRFFRDCARKKRFSFGEQLFCYYPVHADT